jgi:RNA polymerase sigma-70 factor (ECF subfamily)
MKDPVSTAAAAEGIGAEGASASPADPRRLRALVDAHIDAVARVAARVGVPQADVDDVVQQVFVVAARRLCDVEPGAERAFLMKTAVHMALKARRALGRRRESALADADGLLANDAPGADDLLDRARARALLDRVLGAMPDELRVPFVLFELEELTVPEIAQIEGIPPGTAASRLRRAREDFRERLNRLRGRAKGM